MDGQIRAGRRSSILGFPDPVNEVAARIVAGVVVAVCLITILAGAHALSLVVAYGFWARVLTGPTLSPIGRFAVWVAPRVASVRPTPGPPKRFAQGIGAALSTVAVVGFLAGASGVTVAALGAIVAAASLEAAFGFCLGCRVFSLLMRVGVIPESVCEECADISARLSRA